MSNTALTSKPLSRQQIKYAVERCRRIAAKKIHDLEDTASEQRDPELTDYDRVMMIKDGTVALDVSRVKPERTDRYYYHAPRIVDCADFSGREKTISAHNKEVEKRLKAAKERVSRRTAAIIDRFELGEPAEALDLLTKFEAEEFSL